MLRLYSFINVSVTIPNFHSFQDLKGKGNKNTSKMLDRIGIVSLTFQKVLLKL